VPLPPAWFCVFGPSGLLHEAGQGRMRAAPGFEVLPHGTRARAEGHSPTPVLQTSAQGATTRGLTLRHHPTPPFSAHGETRRKRDWSVHTITPVAIPQTAAPRSASIPTHPQTQQHLCEIVTPIVARAVGRARGPQLLRFVLIRSIACTRRRVLLSPGGRDGLHRQCVQGDGVKHPIEIGGQPGSEDVP
jgi:hypothetical protein